MSTLAEKQENKYLIVIGVLSVAIPLVVALLLFMPQTGKLGDIDVSALPHLNALLNSATALCLIAALVAIKKNMPGLHKKLMLGAFTLSSLFLVSYVVYHYQGEHTLFGDLNKDGIVDEAEKTEIGGTRAVYLIVLVSHIILATVVVPFVLLALYFAFSGQFAKHKRVVKWAYPIWLYVAVTGVAVYLMIRPFY